jgi:SPP1 gp7 family putative phage head morphogenesis protein
VKTKSANQKLYDEMIAKQAQLHRVAINEAGRYVAEFKVKDQEFTYTIHDMWREGQSVDHRAKKSIFAKLNAIRQAVWRKIVKWFRKFMGHLAKAERLDFRNMVLTNAPKEVKVFLTGATSVDAILRMPVVGYSVEKWLLQLAESDAIRLRAATFSASSARQLQETTVGTKILNYSNGTNAVAYRNIRTVVTTATEGVASNVQYAITAENPGVFTKEVYTAVLDTRTSALCRTLHGRVYPVGEGPVPPMHPNCRSKRVPLFEGQGVPPVETFQEWFERQDEDTQRKVLGKNRYELWRAGKLTLDKFVDSDGEQYTLKELYAKYPEAFED